MPTMADIIVKKSDGTTDVTYSAVQASGGDKSPAIWRSTAQGPSPALQPEMKITSRPNGDGSVRRIEGEIDFKQWATGPDGVNRKINVAILKFQGVVPQGMDSVNLGQFSHQAPNLIASVLIKACLASGFAPQ